MRLRPTEGALTALACVAVVFASAAPAAGKTVTKQATFSACIAPALPIPSRGVDAASLEVPVPKNGKKRQSGIVVGVTSVGVRLTANATGVVDLSLVSPGGRAIALAVSEGSSRDGFGSGATSCSGSLAQFSDIAPVSIADVGVTGDDPIAGAFRPEQPLAAFTGGPARGPWILLITNDNSTTAAVLDAFSLNLTYTFKKPVKKKKK